MELTDATMRSYTMASVFKDNSHLERANSLDIHGEMCFTATETGALHVYNTSQGKKTQTLFSKEFGIDNAIFSHNEHYVLHCCPKKDVESIRTWCLYDNKYTSVFRGHTKKVTAISLSPTGSVMLSSAVDGSFRLWDLKSESCVGKCSFGIERGGVGQCALGFDPEGLVFAVAFPNGQLKLFDARNPQAPFETFRPDKGKAQWTSLSFSPDGKQMLLGTTSALSLVMDSFEDKLIHSLSTYSNATREPLCPSYTRDGRYITVGDDQGEVYVYRADTGKEVGKWKNRHAGAVCKVLWSPKTEVAVTSHINTALWLPGEEEEDDSMDVAASKSDI